MREFITEQQAQNIKNTYKKDTTCCLIELYGKELQTEKDYLSVMRKKLKDSRLGFTNIHAYIDIMSDLFYYYDPQRIIYIIHDYNELLRQSGYDEMNRCVKGNYGRIFDECIIPCLRKEGKYTIVEGENIPIHIYCVGEDTTPQLYCTNDAIDTLLNSYTTNNKSPLNGQYIATLYEKDISSKEMLHAKLQEIFQPTYIDVYGYSDLQELRYDDSGYEDISEYLIFVVHNANGLLSIQELMAETVRFVHENNYQESIIYYLTNKCIYTINDKEDMHLCIFNMATWKSGKMLKIPTLNV